MILWKELKRNWSSYYSAFACQIIDFSFTTMALPLSTTTNPASKFLRMYDFLATRCPLLCMYKCQVPLILALHITLFIFQNNYSGEVRPKILLIRKFHGLILFPETIGRNKIYSSLQKMKHS